MQVQLLPDAVRKRVRRREKERVRSKADMTEWWNGRHATLRTSSRFRHWEFESPLGH